MTQRSEVPTAAFILSLVAGILILIGGTVGMALGMLHFSGMMTLREPTHAMGGMMGGMGGMMGMGGTGGLGFMFGFGLIGLISGVIVLTSALMLNREPQRTATWGALVLAFSILGLFGGAMGGFGVGVVLGVVGGILAVTWKPTANLT